MLTAQQVQDAIESGVSDEYGAYEFYGDWWPRNSSKMLTIDGVDHEVTLVDEYGGMDMGTELWVVIKIGDQMFKKYGAYYSHDGYYWDGSLDEVRPVQKTITVFE